MDRPAQVKLQLQKLHQRNEYEFFKWVLLVRNSKDLRDVIDKAKENLRMNMGRSILFVDEIHRFSTSQQDFLLPYVEAGDIVLIRATTENPFSC